MAMTVWALDITNKSLGGVGKNCCGVAMTVNLIDRLTSVHARPFPSY